MDLSADVQSLPKELYDKIYDLVFTAKSTKRMITIDPSYQPPAMLQVSRATRQKFAVSYYASAGGFELQCDHVLRKWLLRLSLEHRGLIKYIGYYDQFVERTFEGPFNKPNSIRRVLDQIQDDRMEEALDRANDIADYENGDHGDSDDSEDSEVYSESSDGENDDEEEDEYDEDQQDEENEEM